MLDGLSLDQLRTFVAAVDEGSFSAAGRRLGRVQSAISALVARLEGQVGVALFDRSRRQPVLTAAGAILLADARAVLAGVDAMRARAKGMVSGIEPELSMVVDVMFPLARLAAAARAFREAFPRTPLRIDVEVMGGAYEPVIQGRASMGVVGPLPTMPAALTTERLLGIPIAMVAAHNHPLALHCGPIARAELARHVQLVLSDRSHFSDGHDINVISRHTWRLADLHAKRAFLLEGLGWGGMPVDTIRDDITAGRLVALSVEDTPAGGLVRPLSAAWLTAAPPGPAGRWFIDRLKGGPSSPPAGPLAQT